MTVQQRLLQTMHNLDAAGGYIHLQSQFQGNRLENIFRGQARIGQIDNFNRIRQAFLQHSAQHGLAGTDFTHDFNDALTAGNGVDQGIQDFTTTTTGIKKSGVRSQPKRGISQAKVLVIHGQLLSLSGSLPRR